MVSRPIGGGKKSTIPGVLEESTESALDIDKSAGSQPREPDGNCVYLSLLSGVLCPICVFFVRRLAPEFLARRKCCLAPDGFMRASE